jgi:hypothetical protein
MLIKTLNQLFNILWCGNRVPQFLAVLFQAYNQSILPARTKPFQPHPTFDHPPQIRNMKLEKIMQKSLFGFGEGWGEAAFKFRFLAG